MLSGPTERAFEEHRFTVQELEAYKWSLMMQGRAWEALAVQYEIDEVLKGSCFD